MEFYDFPYITVGIIIPTDELHEFSEGWLNHQPDELYPHKPELTHGYPWSNGWISP
jgi:hypothetical protein